MTNSPHRVRVFALVLPCLCLVTSCRGGDQLTIPPDPSARSDDGRMALAAYSRPISSGRARLQSLRGSRRYPALSVAVVVGHETVWAEASGWASIQTKIAATTASRFPIASVSKPITAAVVMRLAERGVLDLDSDIRAYVPDFPKQSYPITSRQLLSHQAGIRHYRRMLTQRRFSESTLNRDFPDLTSALTLFSDDELAFEPDTDFLYSTFGYTLLGAVVEGATGKRFLDVLQDEILARGRMLATGPDSSKAISGRTGDYEAGKDPGSVRTAPVTNSSYKWPGGGLLSTATDLARFGAGLLDAEMVSATSRIEMFTPRRLRGGAENTQRYGLGWRAAAIRDPTDSTRQITVVYHGGTAVGSEAALVLIPEAGVAVAVTGNAYTGGDAAMVDVAIAIARDFMQTQRK